MPGFVTAVARKVNAPELVALVRAEAIFHKGKLLERPTTSPRPESRTSRSAPRRSPEHLDSPVLTIPRDRMPRPIHLVHFSC